MIVCRVEDPGTRLGPYRTGGVSAAQAALARHLTGAHRDDPERPTPLRDVAGWAELSARRAQAYVAGFDTPDQVQAWFAGHLDALRAAGFVVAAYDVPRRWTLCGDRQVMFCRDRAEHLGDHDLGAHHAAFGD